MSGEQKHPADEIGRALSRAGGILALLSSCYDKSGGQFETGTSFVFESIVAIEAAVENATRSLAKLYQTCDLSVVREFATDVPEAKDSAGTANKIPEVISQEETANSEPLPMPISKLAASRAQQRYNAPPAEAGSYLGFFGPPEQGAKLTERVENILATSGVHGLREQTEEVLDWPAETYEQLLQKVTAVADQAAFQAHQSPADRGLLPALEGIRADLIKLRSVA